LSSSGSSIRLIRAETLHALGRIDEARTAIQEAREFLRRTRLGDSFPFNRLSDAF
jgi:hypothetical protein